jgi:hypothetical protein
MEAFYHFQEEFQHRHGEVAVTGFDNFKAFSNHPLATRKYDPSQQYRFEIRLSPRQLELRKFAAENEYTYFPQKIQSTLKYKGFPIQSGTKIQFEENILEKYLDHGRISVSDITLTEGAGQAQHDTQLSLVQVTEFNLLIPDFALEPESLWSKLSELSSGKDIDFSSHPVFSKKYYLRSLKEEEVRHFFSKPLITFLEDEEPIHIECYRNKLLLYLKRELLEVSEIIRLEEFAERFLAVCLTKNQPSQVNPQ